MCSAGEKCLPPCRQTCSVAQTSAYRLSLVVPRLQEGAHRRQACARPDHHDRGRRRRELEGRGADEAPHCSMCARVRSVLGRSPPGYLESQPSLAADQFNSNTCEPVVGVSRRRWRLLSAEVDLTRLRLGPPSPSSSSSGAHAWSMVEARPCVWRVRSRQKQMGNGVSALITPEPLCMCNQQFLLARSHTNDRAAKGAVNCALTRCTTLTEM